MITESEAMRELGIAQLATLHRWMKQLDVTAQPDSADRRRKLITRQDMERLRALKRQKERNGFEPQYYTKGSNGSFQDSQIPDWAKDVQRRLERIERQLGIVDDND